MKQHSDIIIRLVQPSDAAMLHDNCFVMNTLEEVEERIKSNLESYAAGEMIHLVAEVDGVVVGNALLLRNKFGLFRHRAELCDMVVASEYQGRGIARRLIETLRVHAAQMGIRIFETSVRGGTAAEEVYRKVGFQEYGRLPGGLMEPWGEQLVYDLVLSWMPVES